MVFEKDNKLKLALGCFSVALIIFLSLAPRSFAPDFDPSANDVLSHFIAYFIMMLWYARIFSAKYHSRLAAIFICLGIGLEFMQGILGTREFQTIDILFNATGVLFAWLFAKIKFAPAFSK